MNGIDFNRLYFERKRRRLTQEALAKSIGISRVSYVNIEAGKAIPTVPTLIQMAETLNVSIDYLVGLSNTREIQAPSTNISNELRRIIDDVASSDLTLRADIATLLRVSLRLINESISQEPK